MRTVTRTEYYDFIKAKRADHTSVSLIRKVRWIHGLEHIVEKLYVQDEQVAQAIECKDNRTYIIIEGQ